ncbi:Hypothetical protein, putative [Bodo saltans]|uniref:Pentacotripeptide-repeat region of PRORP domain-containing protein n=1 Tax=Bodo saltans TaxID=75058 RepID=A0A0S4J3H1_BODSA|nr:Hypothetical protein, putative [Bodo saltans]|eukprot:CUG07536.1 Hypothetical protein, putative [Bodo saltans]
MSLAAVSQEPSEARDLAATLMKTYAGVGNLAKLRSTFLIGVQYMRDNDCLNATLFDTYLAITGRRTKFSIEEVQYVLKLMEELNIAKTSHTYLYLIELHLRMDRDPSALWYELLESTSGSEPPITAAIVKSLFLHVLPTTKDPRIGLGVMRELLALDHLDRPSFAAVVTQWMGNREVAPEHSLWLLFEFEQRCILEKQTVSAHIQKQHVAQLMLQCAKCADALSADKLLSFMDRHMLVKSADIMSLVVWCYAQAESVEAALDVVEIMSRRGYLDGADIFKPFTVEVIHYTMERHVLLLLADSLHSVALVERAVAHLHKRREAGKIVTIPTLDVVTLAWSKLGHEDRAVAFVDEYMPTFGASPRTHTYNCLMLASIGTRKSSLHRQIFDRMVTTGVAPNSHTFRLVIRQAINCNDIDEAVRYLESVSSFQGLRIEIEMILMVMERAARAGDVRTVNRISKFSLDCDLGIDSVVIKNVKEALKEHGCEVATLESHAPLHEALRSRSKAARRRTKYDVGL